MEYELLRKTMQNIEQGYQDGCPPHHLSEAQDVPYINQRSRIFVTTPAQFQELSEQTIQEIFRHHHILVTGAEAPKVQFNRDALSHLGSLETLRVMHGVCQS